MAGIRARDGAVIGETEHIHQSIGKILSTRIGTRVLRRDFGSDLPNLIDAPINEQLKLDLYVATVEALTRWEPRIEVKEVALTGAGEGWVELRLVATHRAQGERLDLVGILVR